MFWIFIYFVIAYTEHCKICQSQSEYLAIECCRTCMNYALLPKSKHI